MRVLILSMTVGQGHNAASQALKKYLDKNGHECEILDTYKFLNRAIGVAFDKGYTLMGRIWPTLNENIYSTAERYNGRADMKMYFPWLFADINKTKMQKYINEKQPDVIVCTIVMTGMLISLLKDAGSFDDRIKTIGVVTDYSLHPFWEYTDMDYFVCPNELMVPSIVKRGIVEEKILPIGIPVDEKFSRALSKEAACEKLGLAKDKFTVLLSSGGMGFAGMTEVLGDIDQVEDIQIIAVCGTNARLYEQVNATKYKNKVCALRFVENMDEYMDTCDVFITKPGGLSTSEAIAKKKPLLLAKPMPGVEYVNQTFLINNSLAVHANKYQPASEVILQMKRNGCKTEEMRKAQETWGKPESAKTLGDFMERLVVQ
ncbi:hypothetical protein LJC56_07350 [Christensenellaceae bacterium OttesenSCG-928-K19]|nr:hypothetical protein [Christensenellaceae bacterium OttesenSCG-928-K19]